MPREQRLWVPWSTADDLLRAAAAQGTPASKRLVVDWTERGLLDHPRAPGRGQGPGRAKGRWPWNQRQLFLVLLRKRPSKRAHFAALFNIPVALWLIWGDEFVPLDQARRCLVSWHGRLGRTTQDNARRAARRTVRQLAHPDATKTARKALAEHLETLELERNFDPQYLHRLLGPVIDPHRSGVPRGPVGGFLTAETYEGRVEARILGEIFLAEFSDTEFKRARTMYRRSRAYYFREWKRLAADPDLGRLFEQPTPDNVINYACVDMTSMLGILLRGGTEAGS